MDSAFCSIVGVEFQSWPAVIVTQQSCPRHIRLRVGIRIPLEKEKKEVLPVTGGKGNFVIEYRSEDWL